MKLTWEPFDPERLGYAFLADWLKEFYSAAPWHEHLKCFTCASRDDFGLVGRYGLPATGSSPLEACPQCGGELAPFWSSERVATRIGAQRAQGELVGFVAVSKGQPVAWMWGYRIDAAGEAPWGTRPPGAGMFADRIMVVPEYRNGIALLYLLVLAVQRLKQTGCGYIITKTHVDAADVVVLLKRLGFTALGLDPELEGRRYWIRPLSRAIVVPPIGASEA